MAEENKDQSLLPVQGNVQILKTEALEVDKVREMNLPMLSDIQSKLMLVVGRNDEAMRHVDRFVEVKINNENSMAISS